MPACRLCKAEKGNRLVVEWKHWRPRSGRGWPPPDLAMVLEDRFALMDWTYPFAVRQALRDRDARVQAAVVAVVERAHAGIPGDPVLDAQKLAEAVDATDARRS